MLTRLVPTLTKLVATLMKLVATLTRLVATLTKLVAIFALFCPFWIKKAASNGAGGFSPSPLGNPPKDGFDVAKVGVKLPYFVQTIFSYPPPCRQQAGNKNRY